MQILDNVFETKVRRHKKNSFPLLIAFVKLYGSTFLLKYTQLVSSFDFQKMVYKMFFFPQILFVERKYEQKYIEKI